MEQAKREVDAMDSHPASTFFTIAPNFHVIQSQVLQLFERKGGKHYPRNDRVDEKDEGVGNPRGHTDAKSQQSVTIHAHLLEILGTSYLF